VKRLEGPLATLGPSGSASQPEEDEVPLPADATSLYFMQAIYRDSRQPMQRRMRAAVAALPFEHPKLAVTVDASRAFAAQMEARQRELGMSPVIDAVPKALPDPEGR
jgi:hypothetical protein